MPAIKYRWKQTNRMISGRQEKEEAAIRSFHFTWYYVLSETMPTVRVFSESLDIRTAEYMYSFQPLMKVKMDTDAMPGSVSGRMIFQKV